MNYVDSWLDTFERTARVGAVVDDAASKKSKGKSNSDSNSYMLEGTLGTTNIRKGLQKSLKAYVCTIGGEMGGEVRNKERYPWPALA